MARLYWTWSDYAEFPVRLPGGRMEFRRSLVRGASSNAWLPLGDGAPIPKLTTLELLAEESELHVALANGDNALVASLRAADGSVELAQIIDGGPTMQRTTEPERGFPMLVSYASRAPWWDLMDSNYWYGVASAPAYGVGVWGGAETRKVVIA